MRLSLFPLIGLNAFTNKRRKYHVSDEECEVEVKHLEFESEEQRLEHERKVKLINKALFATLGSMF